MRTILLALALFLALMSTASAADPSTYLDEADRHWGDHACAGQVQVSVVEIEGEYAGYASGVRIDGESWTLADCGIQIDPTGWDTYSLAQQCGIVVHEVGHLALHKHEEGGIMTPGIPDAMIPPACDFRTPRERAIDTLLAHAKTDTIACGKQKGKVFYCRTDSTTGQRRFRVRTYAHGYAWREVRLPKQRATVIRFR